MKIKPRPMTLSFADYAFVALVVTILGLVAFGLVNFNYKLEGGGEFYLHVTASSVFIFDRIDPYSAEVPARVQLQAYGRAADRGEKPYILDTPFHLLLLYFPFAFFSDPLYARAVYTLILELALLPLALASLWLTDWETPYVLGAFFAALGAFNFYAFAALHDASPVLLLALIYAGILFALRSNLDEVAGALVAVAFYRWEVGAPFLFLVALRAYREKRTGVLYGFLMLTTLTALVSIFLYANWFIPFLRAVVNNLRVDYGYNIRDALMILFPKQGNALAWTVRILLCVALAYEWSLAREADFRRFYWAACLSLAAAPLLGFRVELANLSVLVVPLALIFSVAHDRWKRVNNFLVILLMLFVALVPWALPLLPFDFTDQLVYLFLPVFTVVGLYWIRWWALRPPRIWTDLAPR